jgi:hypothetical protein
MAMIQAIERGYTPSRSAVIPRVEQVLDAMTHNEQRPGARNPTVAKANGAGPSAA